MNSKIFTRVLSGAMAFLMILGIFPVGAFAAENEDVIVIEAELTVTVVSENDTGTPLEGAKVYVAGKDSDPSTPDVEDPFVTAKPDEESDPQVTITGLETGTAYTLTVQYKDHVEKVQEITLSQEATAVKVELTALVDADVTVTDKSGDAITGASITVGTEENPRGVTASANEGEPAKLTLENLVPGQTYTLTVAADGYLTATATLECTEENIKNGFKVELTKLYDVELTVMDNASESQPVNGATVVITDKDGNAVTIKDNTTDDNGKVVLNDLIDECEYTVTATCVGYKTGSATFTCSETVHDNGTALTMERADVKLSFVNDLEEKLDYVTVTIDGTPYRAGENYEKILTGLEYGADYTATLTRKGYEEKTIEFKVDDDTIQNGETVTMDRMAKDIILTVTADGNALAGASVSLDGEAVGVTDELGQLTLTDLRYLQKYAVYVELENYDPANLVVSWSDEDNLPAPVVELTPYEYVTINGTVVDDTGASVQDARIFLTKKPFIKSPTDSEPVEVTLNSDGTFSVTVEEQLFVYLMFADVCDEIDKYKEVTVTELAEEMNVTLPRNEYEIKVQVEGDGGTAKVDDKKKVTVRYGEEVTVEVDADETYSIYYILDNGEPLMTDSENEAVVAGKTAYEFTLENVEKDHTIKVKFSQDIQKYEFCLHDDGKFYKPHEKGKKPEEFSLKGLTCEREGEGKNAKYKVKFEPEDNYRVTYAKSGREEVTPKENGAGFEDEEFYTVKCRKYQLTVQLNSFAVTIPEEVQDRIGLEINDTTKESPDDVTVDYGRSFDLTITPEKGKYVSSLTVNDADVTNSIVYTGKLPKYTQENVTENKTIGIEFADVEEIAAEDIGGYVVIKADDSVYVDGTVYYLNGSNKVVVKPAESNTKISRIETGEFCNELELAGEDKLKCVYLLKDNVITKVNCEVETVVDEENPELGEPSTAPVKDDNKITAIEVTINASDKKNGSGVNRVVYSKDPDAEPTDLDTVMKSDEPGVYYESFEDEFCNIYFWAIDNVGRVSEVQGLFVDSDTDKPEVTSFTVNDKTFRRFDHTYTDDESNQQTEYCRYPMAEGIQFTVKAKDKAGIQDDTVVIELYNDNGVYSQAMNAGSVNRKTNEREYTVTVLPSDVTKILSGTLSVRVRLCDAAKNKNETIAEFVNTSNMPGEAAFIFEKNAPKITATTEMEAHGSENWHERVNDKGDVVFSVNITDYIYSGDYTVKNLRKVSGLDTSTIKVYNVLEDGTPLEVYPKKTDDEDRAGDLTVAATNGKTKGEAYAVSISESNDNAYIKVVETNLTIKAEGEHGKLASFDLSIEAKDNEGNAVVLTSENCPALKFKIDNTKPVVEKFDLYIHENEADPEPEHDNKYDTDSGELTDVTVTDYGYFFRKKTTIRVYATDSGSGVQGITFFGKSKDKSGEDISETTVSGKDLKIDGEYIYADFTVNPNFKGQIYAYATDNVGNKGLVKEPKNLTITESQENHANSEIHVALEIEKRETEIVDENNVRLFSLYEYVEDENGELVVKVDEETGEPVGDYVNGVPVEVVVKDTYNGILRVHYEVTAGTNTVLEGTFETTGLGETYKDKNGIVWSLEKAGNLYTTATATILVKENANNIEVSVSMRDMANNWSKEPINLSIDNTLPEMEIRHVPVSDTDVEDRDATYYPPREAEVEKKGTTKYYVGFDAEDAKEDVEYDIYENSTLQVRITERNLDVDSIVKWVEKINVSGENDKLSKDIKIYGPYLDSKDEKGNKTRVPSEYPHSDKTYYLLELENCTEDEDEGGTYKSKFTVKDLFGNEHTERENFVIDMIAPKVTIAFDNNEVRNGKYYNADRTATITVKERNYDNKNGVKVDGTATLDGETVDFPKISAWETDKTNTVHTAKVVFNSDADYNKFTVTYTDLAGHTGASNAKDFVIDKTVPVISIADIMDKSANNDVVAPSITYTDINLDLKEVEITLTGANSGEVNYDAVKQTVKHGEELTYKDFARVKAVDDIYTLYVHAIDKAGNVTTETITFSCNRFGSVFDLSSIKDMLNKFNQEERTIVVTETNVDALDQSAVRVTLTKNGTPVDLVAGQDFTIQMVGGEGSWHQYIYKVESDLFEDDGTYSLYFYTVDAAGNINENIDDSKEAQISFGIDKTKPIVTPIDLESGEQYPVESKTVIVEIKDNLQLQDVKIYLDDEEVTYIADGDAYTFDIAAMNRPQSLKVVVTDAAGNEEEVLIENFLITTSFWARWYYNTPLFIGSLVLIGALMGGLIWWLIILLRRKKEEEEEAAV